MSGSFESHKYSIGTLLGPYERRSVVLPRFQRGYSWEKTQVSTFWSDLITFEKTYGANPVTASYFFGPIVTLEDASEIILLDGQQRLATATILLVAMRDLVRTIDLPGSHEGSDFARDIQRELIEKDSKPLRYALKLGELDEAFFQKTIQEDPPKTQSAKLRSQKNISASYQYLSEAAKEEIKGKSPSDALERIRALKDCLVTGVIMVAITVKEEDDAYRIFETLNDRGLRLSVPDLLLNLLMRRSTNATQRNQVRQKWNYMLQQMGRRDIARFIRHMWLSKYGDLKARGLFVEIKNHIETHKFDSLSFAQVCADECDSYISLIDIKGIPPNSVRDVSGLVKYLEIQSSLPLLLSGLRCLTSSDFTKLCKIVSALAVRYTLIANLNPADLESTFYEAAREIRGKKSSGNSSAQCLKAARALLKTIDPDDSIVDSKLTELELTRRQALWLLTMLGNSKQTATKEISLDQANLEHIFPQKPTLTEWPNKSDLEPFLWNVGNLTILGTKLNEDAANKAFLTKRNSYYKKSEIKLTQELLKYGQWTPAEVKLWAKELAKLIKTVWPKS